MGTVDYVIPEETRAIVEQLRRRRQGLGMTRVALSQAAGLEYETVKRIETFKRTAQIGTLLKYANAVGLTLILAPKENP